jgi:hypothetical protein
MLCLLALKTAAISLVKFTLGKGSLGFQIFKKQIISFATGKYQVPRKKTKLNSRVEKKCNQGK